MKRLFTLLHIVLFSASAFAQEKALNEIQTTQAWCKGSIVLNDGEVIEGLLRFDDKNSLISYKEGDVSRSYTARSVSAFGFWDVDESKQRSFYSLEYMDPKNNAMRPLFFELLVDFKNFAVISKIDPIEITTKSSSTPYNPGYNPGFMDPSNDNYGKQTEIMQTETVYFLNTQGEIEPYLRVVRTVIDRTFFDREKQKNKILDKGLVEKYFKEDEIEEMKKFAERNDLEFRIKNDLIRILEYCLEVRNKKKD